ncbi:9598_t:CDS:2 [Paraglomus brasilianum]|uniref:9598_t:CDS:1 n=1 Tax=Paraglomus brasilianum TaxID=144538 RepID=A0A9N9FTJ0_9GLOM|nr:9598_t:CDS:2 [Paraglomus brasilianum]
MFPFGEMRIYHCDLRLDNVVVDVSNIKLTDFGLAVKEERGLDIQFFLRRCMTITTFRTNYQQHKYVHLDVSFTSFLKQL